MLARGPHLQETFALQVAQRRERAQEEQHKAERSVAGRVRQVLLSEDRSRQGEYLCISFPSYTTPRKNGSDDGGAIKVSQGAQRKIRVGR